MWNMIREIMKRRNLMLNLKQNMNNRKFLFHDQTKPYHTGYSGDKSSSPRRVLSMLRMKFKMIQIVTHWRENQIAGNN